MRYIALLRGINAGGKRKVPMVKLKQLFTELGYTDVTTYINSGNVLFRTSTSPRASEVEKQLENKFGFPIDTIILTASEFTTIAEAIPPGWQNDYMEHKSDVAFLFPDIDSPKILEQIGMRSDVETLIHVKGAILSSLPRKNQPKSSLARCIGTPLYKRMTVRNITTVRKLAEMMKE